MDHTRALVWFKRDLRLRDHAPLEQAQRFKDALAVYVIEPEWLASDEFDVRHAEFALSCLAELRSCLSALGLPLLVLQASMTEVLEDLHRRFRFTHLLSHEETGPGWTWTRDRAVKRWCATHNVVWREWPQTGVIRRLSDRRGWAGRWQRHMDGNEVPTPSRFHPAETMPSTPVPSRADLGCQPSRATWQPAGETAAWRTLDSFLQERARGYRSSLSSPLSATEGCSRLSPHLAFGTISLRSVHQATEAAILGSTDPALRHSLKGFSGRLRWHCHFMQKLEDEPAIEFRNFARSCDGLREGDFREDLFAAWCEGRTGFPMVDACMRSLRATGWLNFRMRAMLVSFAAYHLWLHWRPSGQFLARQFLDFEAGIHWSQMQMQSGTTGINTLRIYSPTKQARDHDPDGIFIRRWVPELASVPTPLIATPWLMDASSQSANGCQIGRDYPAPIVDEKSALQAARERLYGLRQTETAREEADSIQRKHGSRRSGLPPSGKRVRPKPRAAAPASVQLELFDAPEAGN